MNKEEAGQLLYNKTFEPNEKFAVCKSVKAGKLLLKRNIFNNKYTLKKPGFRLVKPLIEKVREVDTRVIISDWPIFTFFDVNNVPVYVDLVAGTKIAIALNEDNTMNLDGTLKNIIKAKDNAENSFIIIYSKIRNILTPLFKSLSYEQIAEMTIDENSDNEYIQKLYAEFKAFKKNFGIEIASFEKKDVQLPQELQAVHAAKRITEKKNEAILNSAEAKVKVTEYEAQAKKIAADANAYELEKKNEVKADLVAKLKASGMTDDKIMEYLKIETLGSSNAKVTAIVGDTTGMAQTMAQLGAVYNNVKQGMNEEQTPVEEASHVKTLKR